MAKEKRFEKVYSQGLGEARIMVDRETGVNYLFIAEGYAGGLTPLLDAQGNVVITPVHKERKGPEL
ncbi:MAG: xylan 1,4-beta-xylosidase [Clostridiales bacterium]|nr:xylan 1,4-beta-xylosidase [Candidatus Cacconaster stercorequi]